MAKPNKEVPAKPAAAVVPGAGDVNYFKGVVLELRKVTWPTGSELWRMTMVVIMTVILIGAIISFSDYLLGLLVQNVLLNPHATSSATALPSNVQLVTPTP